MRYHLLGEGSRPKSNFDDIRLDFLDTESRQLSGGSNIYQQLRGNGINHIVHGHDSTNAGKSIDMYGMKITGNDFGYEKAAGSGTGKESVINIKRNGTFQYGNGTQMKRGEEDIRRAA